MSVTVFFRGRAELVFRAGWLAGTALKNCEGYRPTPRE